MPRGDENTSESSGSPRAQIGRVGDASEDRNRMEQPGMEGRNGSNRAQAARAHSTVDGPQPGTSVHSDTTLDLDAPEPHMHTTSSYRPLGLLKAELFPHVVEYLSGLDEAASLSFRNHQFLARQGQDPSVSHAPPKGTTMPQEHPGEPWHAPDHGDCEECLKGPRHILSQAEWLDATGLVNSFEIARPPVANARSRRQKPRQSPFHWRDGAWPVLPGTASANRPAVSRLF